MKDFVRYEASYNIQEKMFELGVSKQQLAEASNIPLERLMTLLDASESMTLDELHAISESLSCRAITRIEPLPVSFKHGRTKARRNIRKVMFKFQRGRCIRCNRKMIETGKGGEDNLATIDHIIPVARGGTDSVSNLRLVCGQCNQELANEMGLNDLNNE